MVDTFSETDARAHDAAYERAWSMIKKHIDLDSGPGCRPGPFARWRLRSAVRNFERILEINPRNHAAMWALGKIHQRLECDDEALSWFERAVKLQPNQADYAREAGVSALQLGNAARAIAHCESAASLSPEDPGLLANLSLAHLIAGDSDGALRHADAASVRAPTDPVTANVLAIVHEVVSGRRPLPHDIRHL